jgi:hypothetical protein
VRLYADMMSSSTEWSRMRWLLLRVDGRVEEHEELLELMNHIGAVVLTLHLT